MKQNKTMLDAIRHELSFFLISPALMWQLLFLIVPLIFVVVLSFLSSEVPGFFRFTLDHYKQLLQWEFGVIVLRSLGLACATALISCLCGYAIAYYLVFRLNKLKLPALFLLIVPFWTNLLVLVYSWFFVLEPNGLLNTVLLATGLVSQPIALFNTLYAVLIVMVYCYLPFMVLPLVSTLEKLDTSLIEASYDLGATARQTFMRVVLPLSAPGIQTGFLLVFVPAFGEFAIPALVGGDKYMFAGTLISHYFLIAKNNAMGAAFTCFSGIILGAVVLVLLYGIKKMLLNSFAPVRLAGARSSLRQGFVGQAGRTAVRGERILSERSESKEKSNPNEREIHK